MSENKKNQKNFSSPYKDVRVIVLLSLLAALSILCGKYLAFPGGGDSMIRFSFENLPILLAAMHVGPIAGMTVGILADLLGCLMVGYAINPIITLGAAAIGLLGGLIPRLLPKVWPRLLRIALTVSAAHLIGSVVIKTFGLAQYYAMPFIVLMLWRLLNYAIISILECALLYLLGKNAAIARQLRAFSKNSSLL
jgi:ECF transporter S component (folate family)